MRINQALYARFYINIVLLSLFPPSPIQVKANYIFVVHPFSVTSTLICMIPLSIVNFRFYKDSRLQEIYNKRRISWDIVFQEVLEKIWLMMVRL